MTKKRTLAFVLALLMCLTILPGGVLAANGRLVSNSTVVIGDYKVELGSGTAALMEYTGSGGAITIPDKMTYGGHDYTVTVLGTGLFQGKPVTSLEIPGGVALRGGAFSDISGLTSVTIKGDLTSSDQDSPAFSKTGLNMKVTFEKKVTKIPAYIFKDSNVASVKIQSAVTVGEHAFEDCPYLETVSGDSKITSIGNYAFSGCKILKCFSFAKDITLGEESFARCSSLNTLVFNGNVKSITGEGNVFLKSGSDMKVTFGSDVTKISTAFVVDGSSASSPKVTKIIFQCNAPSFSENCFKGIKATAYHGDDESWTAAVMQNYGGTIDWKTGEKPVIKTQPKSTAVKNSTKATFKVEATGTDLKYQWQIKSGSSWVDITGSPYSGYNKATMTVTATTALDGKQYRCKVYNDLGEKNTDTVKLTIMVKPTISTHPTDTTANEDKTVTFKVKAAGGELSYQWYSQEKGTTIWNKIKGATKASYSFKATRDLNKFSFRCRVYNKAGSTYTNAAKLRVRLKAKIKTQPSSKTVAAGKTVTFKVKATGTALKYQWYYRTSSKGSWKAVADAWSKSLSLTARKKMNGYQYRCKVYNDFSHVYSKTVTLKIKK